MFFSFGLLFQDVMLTPTMLCVAVLMSALRLEHLGTVELKLQNQEKVTFLTEKSQETMELTLHSRWWLRSMVGGCHQNHEQVVWILYKM
jgi:hypothetical protein